MGEPHLSQAPNEKVLAVRGIRIGEITEIRDVPISTDMPSAGDNVLRLFGYKAGNDLHTIDHDDGSTRSGSDRARQMRLPRPGRTMQQ